MAFVILLLLLVFTWKNGASPMPTSHKMREALSKSLPALTHAKIVELGSGWGNLAFLLSKKYPHCTITAYENSPVPFLYSQLLNYQKNLKIVQANFFRKDLSSADLVVCYLFPKMMERVRDKLERELAKGAHVVTHTYPIPGWEPKEVIEVNERLQSTIYIYEVV
ncbi:MAG: methyltransferase [Chlamydiales bacterium]|nr:methyltransferase [Chlamydiales bacterium]